MKNLFIFKSILLLMCFIFLKSTIMFSQVITSTINHSLTGIGEFNLNLDGNSSIDLKFEIIELTPGVLVAKVSPLEGSKILDNSTFGYPDALNLNDSIKGNFTNNNGVLGTFTTAGNFNGMGEKYLGVKLRSGTNDLTAWVKLYCSQERDTLKIISYAYVTNINYNLLAGQTDITNIENSKTNKLIVYPNPSSDYLNFNNTGLQNIYYEIYNQNGQLVLSGSTKTQINISSLSSGNYIIKYWNQDQKNTENIMINR